MNQCHIAGQSLIALTLSSHASGKGVVVSFDDPSGVPSLSLRCFRRDELTDEVFSSIWPIGEALIVTGCDGLGSWTPERFVREVGTQHCTLKDCVGEKDFKNRRIDSFFLQFGHYQEGRKVLKLKVWI